ncbi:UNVERIFIED_CONTAM: hypothetical protein GTU68_012034, partial [Idotea baltica]|nr:hypothetical protein [Idotea baltica]
MPSEIKINKWLIEQIKRREALGLSRKAEFIECDSRFNFATNDYLALSKHPEVRSCLDNSTAVGASASRLVSGTKEAHIRCERMLAEMCQKESALLFGSGYHANLGLLQGLIRREDIVVADRLLHASMIDGIGLSKAEYRRFKHNDVDDLKNCLAKIREQSADNSRVFILTESIFSISGDRAPLAEIAEVAIEYDALLIVDEAHAFGVFGPDGGGLISELGISDKVFAITGSFAKAVGTYGGFIAGKEELKRFLLGSARAFIFSTALPPALVKASCRSLELIRS